MSIWAYVACNCYREKKATPPPFLREFVGIGPDGLWLLQDCSDEILDLFLKWRERACVHRDMRIAEWSCGWSGVERFRDALFDFGIENFPALAEHLLRADDEKQVIRVEAARAMSSDLERFTEIYRGTGAALIDEQGEDQVTEKSWTSIQEEVVLLRPEGLLFLDGRQHHEIQYATQGRVRRWLEQQTLNKRKLPILFDTIRATQVYVGEIADKYGHRMVEYCDIPSGKRHRSFISLIRSGLGSGPISNELIPKFHVEPRTITADEFQYMTVEFRELLEASVATGNPVMWV